MLMRQVEMVEDNGTRYIGWIDRDHAVEGQRFDLNLGDGKRSPVVTVTQVWMLERDLDEIQERQENRRSFGGSVH
jgi:hypothetical protein